MLQELKRLIKRRKAKTMYRCENCGETFEEPKIVCEDHGYDTEICHIPYYEYVDHCPICDSTDIEEYEEEEE